MRSRKTLRTTFLCSKRMTGHKHFFMPRVDRRTNCFLHQLSCSNQRLVLLFYVLVVRRTFRCRFGEVKLPLPFVPLLDNFQ